MNKKSKIFFFIGIVFLLIALFTVLYYFGIIPRAGDSCKNIPGELSSTNTKGKMTYTYYSRDSCYEELALSSKNDYFCTRLWEGQKSEYCDYALNKINQVPNKSESFYMVLYFIEQGNKYLIENDLSDSCLEYRTPDGGCATSPQRDYFLDSSFFKYTKLNETQKIELCYKFAHKGAVTYCLKDNSQIEKCLEVAENNEYLKKICSLNGEERIDSTSFAALKYSELIS